MSAGDPVPGEEFQVLAQPATSSTVLNLITCSRRANPRTADQGM